MNKGMKKVLSWILLFSMFSLPFTGCGKVSYLVNKSLDQNENITLVIVGGLHEFKALEYMGQKFTSIYPNCKVEYEFLQNYSETLPKSLTVREHKADLFLTTNIQAGSENMNYAMDLFQYEDQLNLSDTCQGLIENFTYLDGNSVKHLYSVPMGIEMRGLYVNTTLLNTLGIPLPTNKSEFLETCDKLKQAGYMPLQGNPGNFGQQLIFPALVHIIAGQDADAKIKHDVAECSDEAAEELKEPLQFLYDLTQKDYYNYKSVEAETGMFKDASNEAIGRAFLNIVGETNFEKVDDIGVVPFMPGANTLKTVLNKLKEDYHSQIEYEFILAPVSDEGGYAHLSPDRGIAVNKDGNNIDWALEFMQFLFTESNMKEFAKMNNVSPNTNDAVNYISKEYGIPVEQITQPQDITFDYNFFSLIQPIIVSVSKANNPKYMQDDGKGNISAYPIEYYIESLKTAFSEQRSSLVEN